MSQVRLSAKRTCQAKGGRQSDSAAIRHGRTGIRRHWFESQRQKPQTNQRAASVNPSKTEIELARNVQGLGH